MSNIRKDLTNKTFGKLVVLEPFKDHTPGKPRYWLCRCECGNKKLIRGTNLTSGQTISCGCWNKQNNYIKKNSKPSNFGKGPQSSKVQHLNKKRLSFNEFCKQYGLTAKIVRGRLKKGWSVNRALNTPVSEQTKTRLQSSRAKGRKLEDYVVSRILHNFPELKKGDDIERVASARAGIDIELRSEKARQLIPISFECKNVTDQPGKRALEQANKNKYENTLPAVVWHPPMERYEDTVVITKLEDLLEWLKKVQKSYS